MRVRRLPLAVLGTVALAGPPVPAGAQPVGEEFQVNTYSTGAQLGSSVAADANGNFVVVWESAGQDGSGLGTFGQRFDAAGTALGAEFKVNAFTTSDQGDPAVSSDWSGNFVVVWESAGQDGSGLGIFGQRFDSEGEAQGSEFRVNSYTTSWQFDPAVASDASGNFVVVWRAAGGTPNDIVGQRYDSAGVAQGGEFRIGSGYVSSPAIASAANGNFVVVWTHLLYPISGVVTKGQRYDSQGQPLGSQFMVSAWDYQYFPKVATHASGNFVVVHETSTRYGGLQGVFGARFDSEGVPQGGEFQVAPSGARIPSVAFDPQSNFVVVWQDDDGSGNGVFGQRYDSESTPRGNEFQINSYTTAAQAMSAVATTDIDQFVVVWHSFRQDGSGDGVFGQRFDFSGENATIHVGDLDGRAKDITVGWRAQVTALIHDDGHTSISGVLVTLNVSGVGTRTCTTTATGRCEVGVVVSDSVPSLTFSVTSLSKAGFSYDSGANHDPDPDSNGTAIVVNQP